jgi:hypothetical protein
MGTEIIQIDQNCEYVHFIYLKSMYSVQSVSDDVHKNHMSSLKTSCSSSTIAGDRD